MHLSTLLSTINVAHANRYDLYPVHVPLYLTYIQAHEHIYVYVGVPCMLMKARVTFSPWEKDRSGIPGLRICKDKLAFFSHCADYYDSVVDNRRSSEVLAVSGIYCTYPS